MARRLGEILVERGACTAEAVREALQNQVIFGGRLGTNLLELEAVKEEALAEALRLRCGVPSVQGDDLHPDPAALALMTPEVADRYDAIPFAVEDHKLVVLAVNPNDLAMLDEVAFATDRNVLALVAPEARVWALLRQHYGIDRQLRGIEVDFQSGTTLRPPPAAGAKGPSVGADLMDQAEFDALYSKAAPTPPPVAAPPRVAAPRPPAPRPPPEDEIIDLTELLEPEPAPPPPAARPMVRATRMARETAMALKAVLSSGAGRRRPATMVLPAIDPSRLPGAPATSSEPPGRPAPSPPPGLEPAPLGFSEAITALAGVEDRDAIAGIVLRHARSRFRRAVLLSVRRNAAWGWAGLGERLDAVAVRRMKLALGLPGVLDTVVTTRAHYLGPLQKTEANVRLLKQLGGGVPKSAILLPVLAQGRVVNVLYADQGRGEQVDPTAVGDLLILATRISQSWDRLLARIR